MEAISRVRKVAGEKTFVSGLSAVVTDTRQLVEDQEAIYVAIAVALCAVVLMLTMDSFLLPLIFLLCRTVCCRPEKRAGNKRTGRAGGHGRRSPDAERNRSGPNRSGCEGTD